MDKEKIRAELDAFIESGKAKVEVNSGNFVTAHIDMLRIAEHFYEQAEKDLTDKAKFSSGWDGFYYGQGYKQAKQDLWHNVKDETPIDGERLLLINRNGEYGTTMLMMPILYKEFRNWEKWAYIKDLIPSE